MRTKIITAILATITTATIGMASRIYPQTMIVYDIDYKNDVVTLATATGILYQYYGIEDADIDDLEAVIMFDAGKEGYVLDDIILRHRYAGFTELFDNMKK